MSDSNFGDSAPPFDIDSAEDCEPDVDPGWLAAFEAEANRVFGQPGRNSHRKLGNPETLQTKVSNEPENKAFLRPPTYHRTYVE